jgi:hypothetical protein
MKKIILVVLMLLSFFGYSQNSERKYLFTNKYGVVNFEIVNNIKDSNSEIYSLISFQNIDYSTITDTRIILLSKKSELKEFADKLVEFSEKEKGVELSFEKEIAGIEVTVSIEPFFKKALNAERDKNSVSLAAAKLPVIHISAPLTFLR